MIFIESKAFTRRLRELAETRADLVLNEIENALLENPEAGVVVRGLGGIRKARAANPARGKGKRGGFRYMYLYLQHRNHIHLLAIIDKDEQEDLSEEERKTLREMVQRLKG